MSNIPKRAPLIDLELSKEEKETTLRALGYYQVHLFDEMEINSQETKLDLSVESRNISSAIKKIHKTIEHSS